MNHEETIFEKALGIPSANGREEFLREACANNQAMFERLHGLLRAHDRAGKFLEHESVREGGQLAPAAEAGSFPTLTLNLPLTEKPGDRIGRYKLLQKIGEGGCGVVYMAEQDEPVRRRVALKIIKLGMDTRQVIARFEAERQALALMDHPNIAKVLDAGSTETGRPYFVMELVRGVKMTEYCDEKKLTTQERLELFIQVCHAIQHAHQKGIIHRDLKPSNILVSLNDGVAVPKIIDFGIAKATSGEPLTDKTVFTAFEQFIGTPAYMSPEQALVTSLDVDTRTDIYALGVLLYELLTGRTPFETKELLGAGLDEMRRTICEREPARPSTRLATMPDEELSTTAQRRGLDAPKLVSQLRGDLDWIVMKCLEKDRARRYETANGLASDIQRHLKNEPVVACPPSNLYRLQKLFRRNRIAVTAGALLIVSLVLGLLVSTWMFAKERKARQRALVAENTARKKEAEAEAASREFQKSERDKHRNLYVAEMGVARAAWENGQLDRAKQFLKAHIPKPGEEDLRGFEWRYLWRICQEDALATLTGHGDFVQCIALSPDARLLAAGLGTGEVKIWDVGGRREVRTLPRPNDLRNEVRSVRSVVFSSDGKALAVAHFCEFLRLWDVATGQLIRTIGEVAPLEKTIRFLTDGRVLACATMDGAITLWDVESGAVVGSMQGSKTARPAIAISPDGALLASSSGDHEILLWDIAERQRLGVLQGHTAHVNCVQFSPDGSLLASASDDSTARLWNVAAGRELALLAGHRVTTCAVTFSPDGGRLASTSIDGLVKLWDVASHVELRTLRGHRAMVNAAVFFPDGKVLASSSDDRTVKLWDISSPTEGVMFKGLGGPARDFHFLPDGNTLAILADDGNVTLWDPATGRQVARISGSFKGFSDTGRIVFGLRTPEELEFWDSTTHRRLATAKGHEGPALTPAFSADDRFFACGDTNGTVRLWEVATGRLQGALPGPTNSINALWLTGGSGDLFVGINRGSNYAALRATGNDRELPREATPEKSWRWRPTFSGRVGPAYFRFWDPRTGNEVEALPKNVRRLQGTLNNRVSVVVVYDGCGPALIESLQKPADEVFRLSSVLALPDGKQILIGGEEDIEQWDLVTGHLVASLKGHGGWVSSLALLGEGQTLVSSANDGTLKLWSMQFGKEVLAFPGNVSRSSKVAVSPDGNSIATLSPDEDRLVRVFYAPPMREIEAEITQMSTDRKN